MGSKLHSYETIINGAVSQGETKRMFLKSHSGSFALEFPASSHILQAQGEPQPPSTHTICAEEVSFINTTFRIFLSVLSFCVLAAKQHSGQRIESIGDQKADSDPVRLPCTYWGTARTGHSARLRLPEDQGQLIGRHGCPHLHARGSC